MNASRQEIARAFGAALRLARTDAGLTQEAVAERGELDRTYPSLLERGARTPTLFAILQLADALGVEPGALVTMAVERLPYTVHGPQRRPP